MLATFFMICAILGGVMLLLQFLMSLFAIGAGHAPHIHHHGSHIGHAKVTVARPASSHRGLTHHPKAPAPVAASAAPAAHHRSLGDRWASSWIHSMLNFQCLVIGLAVLGLAGLAGQSGGLAAGLVLTIALAAALAVMFAVAAFFRAIASLDDDGTVNLDAAVGQTGTVYLSIPGSHEGQGKISLTLQQRLMEFPAFTHQEALMPAGQRVLVVAVHKPNIMEVVAEDKYLPEVKL